MIPWAVNKIPSQDHVDRVIFDKDPGVSLEALEAALPLPPEGLADG
eukprot:s4451_g1.t1